MIFTIKRIGNDFCFKTLLEIIAKCLALRETVFIYKG